MLKFSFVESVFIGLKTLFKNNCSKTVVRIDNCLKNNAICNYLKTFILETLSLLF